MEKVEEKKSSSISLFFQICVVNLTLKNKTIITDYNETNSTALEFLFLLPIQNLKKNHAAICLHNEGRKETKQPAF